MNREEIAVVSRILPDVFRHIGHHFVGQLDIPNNHWEVLDMIGVMSCKCMFDSILAVRIHIFRQAYWLYTLVVDHILTVEFSDILFLHK